MNQVELALLRGDFEDEQPAFGWHCLFIDEGGTDDDESARLVSVGRSLDATNHSGHLLVDLENAVSDLKPLKLESLESFESLF